MFQTENGLFCSRTESEFSLRAHIEPRGIGAHPAVSEAAPSGRHKPRCRVCHPKPTGDEGMCVGLLWTHPAAPDTVHHLLPASRSFAGVWASFGPSSLGRMESLGCQWGCEGQDAAGAGTEASDAGGQEGTSSALLLWSCVILCIIPLASMAPWWFTALMLWSRTRWTTGHELKYERWLQSTSFHLWPAILWRHRCSQVWRSCSRWGGSKAAQADLLECEWEHSSVSAINRIYTD